MAVKGLGLRGRGNLHRAPPPHNGKFHGCGNTWVGPAAPALRPHTDPAICSEAKSRRGKLGVEGAAAGSAAPTSALTSSPAPLFFFKQMSPIDELKVRSSPAPPTQAAHCGGGKGEGGRGKGQGEWGGEPSPARFEASGLSPQPPEGRSVGFAAWGPSPGTRRLASRATARQPSRPHDRENWGRGKKQPPALWGLGHVQLARPGAEAGSWGLPGRSNSYPSGLPRSIP